MIMIGTNERHFPPYFEEYNKVVYKHYGASAYKTHQGGKWGWYIYNFEVSYSGYFIPCPSLLEMTTEEFDVLLTMGKL